MIPRALFQIDFPAILPGSMSRPRTGCRRDLVPKELHGAVSKKGRMAASIVKSQFYATKSRCRWPVLNLCRLGAGEDSPQNLHIPNLFRFLDKESLAGVGGGFLSLRICLYGDLVSRSGSVYCVHHVNSGSFFLHGGRIVLS